MRNSMLPLFLVALPAAGSAQGTLYLPALSQPAQTELPGYSIDPLMRADARMQVFYGAGEVGASTFTAKSLDLRYDGPIPNVGAPGPFTIQRLTIRVGVSTVGTPGAVFDQNLTAPLTTVFDQPITFWPDAGSLPIEPWGGTNGSLSFPFSQPLALSIPQGSWLVFEFRVNGNSLAGAAHAILDAEVGTGGPKPGTSSSSGQGCGGASIGTFGVPAPGAVYSVIGQGLGASAPVVLVIGLSDTTAAFGSLPFTLPGTPCTLYTSFDVVLNGRANAGGGLDPSTFPLAVPANPAFNNLTMYHQLIAAAPGQNPPWGVVVSDKRTVQLGTLQAPTRAMYAVSNATSATAAFADTAGELGLAMRLGVQ